MKLFVDTGNLKEIEALAAIGILDGVSGGRSAVPLAEAETFAAEGFISSAVSESLTITACPCSAPVFASGTTVPLRSAGSA